MGKLPSRTENYSEWYNQLVRQAQLADHSDVRGCMVIKPHGFAIWEKIKEILDTMIKATGHKNAYFPLFIPKSFFSKEAKHVEGFATECAVVTHYRLQAETNQVGQTEMVVDPDAKLEEELIVRPTSETVIRNTYKQWINSYRDLPLLINQWANVVRWEMRTRLFLRTAEFLWQEGHTAHAKESEAKQEAQIMHQVYQDLFQNFLAIDGIMGEKSESERFAGAETTYTIEPMMQDKKALQICTSHFLGQNFAKAFDVTYTSSDNTKEHVRATSWGASTRMMGGLIMAHSDDQGLVLPPAIAPVHVVVVPIAKNETDLTEIMSYIEPVMDELSYESLDIESSVLPDTHLPIHIEMDEDLHQSPGWKFTQHEIQGVPIRITVGPKDMKNGTCEVYRRDTQQKEHIAIKKLAQHIVYTLHDIQDSLLQRQRTLREENTFYVDEYTQFKEKITQGFVMAHRDGSAETEAAIKQETKATIRCIPFPQYLRDQQPGKCIYSGKPSTQRVLFAIAY